MFLRRLKIDNLRNIEAAELLLQPGVNWFVGSNGAGKTSVLEAVSLLSSGRSFRGGSVDGVVRRGAESCQVFAELGHTNEDSFSRVGLERRSRGFSARVDGRAVASLTELFECCPAICVEPDAGELITGPAEFRRRFIDWGLFHVEPSFLPGWRRFQRALKQRNALLRQRRAGNELDAWDQEFADSGNVLHAQRSRYLESLEPFVVDVCAALLPGLGDPLLQFRPGWPAKDESLPEVLQRVRAGDLKQGFSGSGPQRCGWTLTYASLPSRELYSRGQAKLAALCMLLAQTAHFVQQRKHSPVVCLDDVMSELDRRNQQRVIERLESLGCQVLITSADLEQAQRMPSSAALFHVEQGRISRQV